MLIYHRALSQDELNTVSDYLAQRHLGMPGDVDQNGRIDAVDALMTLQAAAQTITLDESQQKAADVDESGTITSADALLILRRATGQLSRFS